MQCDIYGCKKIAGLLMKKLLEARNEKPRTPASDVAAHVATMTAKRRNRQPWMPAHERLRVGKRRSCLRRPAASALAAAFQGQVAVDNRELGGIKRVKVREKSHK
jgi:hypothetical protein